MRGGGLVSGDIFVRLIPRKTLVGLVPSNLHRFAPKAIIALQNETCSPPCFNELCTVRKVLADFAAFE